MTYFSAPDVHIAEIIFVSTLMLSTLGKFSANDILKYFLLFSTENRIWHFMQIQKIRF